MLSSWGLSYPQCLPRRSAERKIRHRSHVAETATIYNFSIDLADMDRGVYETLEARGTQLMNGFRKIAEDSPIPILVQGLPAMSFVAFTDAPALVDHRDVARLDQEIPRRFGALLAGKGIRAHGRGLWLMSAAHSARDIDRTLDASAEAIREIGRQPAG